MALIGDSNTYRRNYPKHLQALLGDDHKVLNFGVSGATLLRGTKISYLDHGRYKKALASKPQILVVMLGTNDAQTSNSWENIERDAKFPGTPAEEFTANMQTIITAFNRLDESTEIFFVKPLPTFPAKSPESWRQSTIGRKRVLENELYELYELIEESAKVLNVKLIDAYTPMKNDSKLTSDGVHFKDAGYKKLAAIIHKRITQ